MADFQAVIGGAGVGDIIEVTPTLIVIKDLSDYIGSTQDGHLTADFSDYKKVIMQNPKRTFVYSTEGDGDSIITAGNTSNTFNFTLQSEDIDGVYDFTLYTVPTYLISATYDRHECVYYNGVLYKNNINGSTGDTPDSSTNWVVINEELLSSKYCVATSIAITDRNLLNCYEELLYKAGCDLQSNLCGSLCDNPTAMKAVKMRMLIDLICFDASNNNFVDAKKKFVLAHQLCNNC